MAKCDICDFDMLRVEGCISHSYRTSDGKTVYSAIPYGSETRYTRRPDPGERCHDCNTLAGSFHHTGCDLEECPVCHGQFISCSCTGLSILTEEDRAARDRAEAQFASFRAVYGDEGATREIANAWSFIDGMSFKLAEAYSRKKSEMEEVIGKISTVVTFHKGTCAILCTESCERYLARCERLELTVTKVTEDDPLGEEAYSRWTRETRENLVLLVQSLDRFCLNAEDLRGYTSVVSRGLVRGVDGLPELDALRRQFALFLSDADGVAGGLEGITEPPKTGAARAEELYKEKEEDFDP